MGKADVKKEHSMKQYFVLGGVIALIFLVIISQAVKTKNEEPLKVNSLPPVDSISTEFDTETIQEIEARDEFDSEVPDRSSDKNPFNKPASN